MKIICLMMMLLLASGFLNAQTIQVDHMMQQRVLSCEDVAHNVNYLIPEFYKNKQLDTLQAIITYWENSCGVTEESIRTRILLAIDQEKFDEFDYPDEIMSYIIMFKDTTRGLYPGHMGAYMDIYERREYRKLISDVIAFNEDLAKDILRRGVIMPEEKFFVNLYANEPYTLKMLEETTFNDTKLQDLYLRERYAENYGIVKLYEFHAGTWIPQDSLGVLGNKFLLGLKIGGKYKRFQAFLNVEARFGRSKKRV